MTRVFLVDVARRPGYKLRSLTENRAYRMPGSTRVIPASAVPHEGTSRGSNDQYSQLEITSAAAAATRWTGVAVRIGDGGQQAYVGICKICPGKSELTLGKRINGKWIRLGRTYRGAPLADGTRLRLVALGSTIAFMENDVIRIAAGDKSLPDGMPGVLVDGAEMAGKLSVGPGCFEAQHLGDDPHGIATYRVISATNSGGPRLLRVLRPDRPGPRTAHNFLFLLPVEAGGKGVYGDGLQVLRSLDAQNEYNLTIIEPSFGIEPWYADNPGSSDVRHETFLVRELIPWARATLGITGDEQNWLVGFSKSGLGAQAMLLKHPDLIDLAASWDFPADMAAHDEYGTGSAACYGTNANYQAHYRLTSQFVEARRMPFRQDRRIWIGQGPIFSNSVARYESILAAADVHYTAAAALDSPHRWDGGWLPAALAGLRESSVKLVRTAACDI
jgi:hypothetical protein